MNKQLCLISTNNFFIVKNYNGFFKIGAISFFSVGTRPFIMKNLITVQHSILPTFHKMSSCSVYLITTFKLINTAVLNVTGCHLMVQMCKQHNCLILITWSLCQAENFLTILMCVCVCMMCNFVSVCLDVSHTYTDLFCFTSDLIRFLSLCS